MVDSALLIFSGASFGGLERRFARLAAQLPVTVYCTGDAAGMIGRLGIGVPADRIRTIDAPGAGKLARLAGLWRWLRAVNRAGHAHVHIAMNPGLVAAIYALFRRWLPPYSLSVVDHTFEHRRPLVEGWLWRYSIRRACVVDCLSRSLAESVQRDTPGVRTAVSPCSFTDYSKVQTAPARDVDVALIARRSPEKGHDLLDAALRSLPPLQVVDRTDDPFGVLARTKVFCSLQRYENYPSQSLIEAMASGCAIVATDVGETRRMLDETCAILVPPDPAAVAEAIRTLLADDALRARLGAAARERVMREHTIERFADYFKEIAARCAA